MACRGGNVELTLDLLDAGVDVETRDTRRRVGLRETCDIEVPVQGVMSAVEFPYEH